MQKSTTFGIPTGGLAPHGCSRQNDDNRYRALVVLLRSYFPSYAFCKPLMSILSICNIASMALFDFSGSLSPNSLPRAEGMICQDRPYLSLSQPHLSFLPPSESFSHSLSTSCCVSQFTKNDIAGVNLNCGPPFRAMNSCPSSWNVADITVPFGSGPPSPYRVTLPTFEFLKIEI